MYSLGNNKQKPLRSEGFLDFVIPSNVEGLRDLCDFHFCEVLAVAITTYVAAFCFVFNNFDFWMTCMTNNFCCHLFAKCWRTEIEVIALSGKECLKRNGLACFCFELFDFDDVALAYEVLFAASRDNCNHRIFGIGRIIAVLIPAVNKRALG